MKKFSTPRNVAKLFTLTAALAVTAFSAQAQRNYGLIYTQNSRGGHTMFGNTSMAIYSSGTGSTGGTVDVSQMNAFSTNSDGTTSASGNDNSNMQFVNIDYATVAPDVIVPYGSAWSESPALNSYPTNWNASSYTVPNTWSTNQTAPVTGTVSSSNHTVLLRSSFTLSNTASYTNYTVNVKYMHGVRVYIDGTQVLQTDLGNSDGAGDNASTSYSSPNTVSSSTFALANGTHTIAVEVHRGSSNGSGSSNRGNVSMNLQLVGNKTQPALAVGNASSADLILPATGNNTIKFARLYWGGRIQTSDITASDANLRSVKLRKGSSGAYTTLTASTLNVDKIAITAASPAATAYQAYYDVTSFIQANGAGTYTVADIAATAGSVSSGGNYAGWSIVVAYENDAQTDYYGTRIYDGFLQVFNSSTSTTVPVTLTGFDAPATPLALSDAYMSTLAWEGDANLAATSSNPAGDFLKVNGVTYSDGVNPATNMWNGTISKNGQHLTDYYSGTAHKNADYKNQMGIDIDEFQVGTGYGISSGATQVAITFGTEADQYFPSAFGFSMKIKDPSFTIKEIATDSTFVPAPADMFSAAANETITYIVSGRNSGTGAADSSNLIDSIPVGTTYVPNSLGIIVSGAAVSPRIGHDNDDKTGDYAFYTPPSGNRRGYITYLLGTGSTADNAGGRGGILQPNDSFRVTFKVKIGSVSLVTNIAYIYGLTADNRLIQNQTTKNLAGPLAIKLSAFNVSANNGNALLTWTSESEKNSDYYAVEKSTNGSDFNQLATIKSNGTTTEAHDYSYTDQHLENSSNYYRLRMVDLDGTYAYSDVRMLKTGDATRQAYMMPNPTTGQAKIVLSAPAGDNATLAIYNALGEAIQKVSVSNQQVIDFNLSNYPAGMYHVIVTDGNDAAYRGKIIKQ